MEDGGKLCGGLVMGIPISPKGTIRGPDDVRGRLGVTLMELLISMTIIVVLIGLAIPAVHMIRESARRTESRQILTQLHTAIAEYRIHDKRRRFPAQEADSLLWYDVRGQTSRILNRIEDNTSYRVSPSHLGGHGDERQLLDGWHRPLRYVVDQDEDGLVERPAPKSSWQNIAQEPYAFLWSLGPVANDNDDAAQCETWIAMEDSRE
jgi:type II secretory pathway pseudopilin PulG